MKQNELLVLESFRRAVEIGRKSIHKDYIKIYFSCSHHQPDEGAWHQANEVILSWDFGIGYRISHNAIFDQQDQACSEEHLLSQIEKYYEVK